MVFLPEAVGGFHGEIEMLEGGFSIAGGQRGLSQEEPGGGILAEHLALAALPRVKTPGGEQIERLLRLAGLVVERGEFHGGVVAFQNERAVAFEEGETICSTVAELGAELHKFGDQPRIGWVAGEGFFIARTSSGGIAAGIPIGNAKVAVRRSKRAVGRAGFLPCGDGIKVALLVVEEIPETVGGVAVGAGLGERPMQDRRLMETRGAKIIRRQMPCGLQ